MLCTIFEVITRSITFTDKTIFSVSDINSDHEDAYNVPT